METKTEFMCIATHQHRDNPHNQTTVIVQYNGRLAPVTKAILAHKLAKASILGMTLDDALAFIAHHFAFSGCNHPDKNATVWDENGYTNWKAEGCGGGRAAANTVHIIL